MKRLNITKEHFEKSKYFTKKYGTLKFVSESGRLFKTDKGKLLSFNEGMKREVMPMNGRKSFGHKAIEEEDDNGFTLFSYETPVARLERRDDGSGLDFMLLNDYLSTTTLTHIHSWLIGHHQKDIPTKKLLELPIGREVPMVAAVESSGQKKLVKEGAGAGYTVHIKDLKFGDIKEKKLVKGKERYDDYYECQVEILPGEYEIAAEDYYNDFFWQEHEFGETPSAKIDGGVATIVYSTNSYDEDEADDELRREISHTEMDIAFGYGWGWVHANLPKDKPIESDHVDVEGREFYGSIDKIELNASDLADAVNAGYQSIYDRDEEEGGEEEEVDESRGNLVKEDASEDFERFFEDLKFKYGKNAEIQMLDNEDGSYRITVEMHSSGDIKDNMWDKHDMDVMEKNLRAKCDRNGWSFDKNVLPRWGIAEFSITEIGADYHDDIELDEANESVGSEPTLDDIYKAVKEEYGGKLFSDNFLKLNIEHVSGQVLCIFELDKPDDLGANDGDDEWWEDKKDSAILFYDELVKFLVDKFGEKFRFTDPRVSDEYADKSDPKGAFEIFIDEDDATLPIITIDEVADGWYAESEENENGTIGGWRVFDYGEEFPYVERYEVLDPDGYTFFIDHNGGVGSFSEDAIEGTSEEICDELEIEIKDKMYKPRELAEREILDNPVVQKGLKRIKVKFQYEKDEQD